MNKTTKEILKATAVLGIICLVIAAALAGTNLLTKDQIAQRSAQAEIEAMQRICKAETYSEQTTRLNDVDYTYYIAESAGTAAGYIFTTEHNGYGGPVSVMTGIDPQGKILAVEILDVSGETVGLGQNAAKPDFTEQFKGKSGQLQVSKTAGEDEIQALTGATITSAAVTDAVNTALQLFAQVKGGAGA